MKRILLTLGIIFLFSNNSLALSYKEIVKQCQSYTDVQFENYAESLRGKEVIWEGIVLNVKEALSGQDYDVLIDMDKTGKSFDVVLQVSKTTAYTLKKHGHYKFSGVINKVANDNGEVLVVLGYVKFIDKGEKE